MSTKVAKLACSQSKPYPNQTCLERAHLQKGGLWAWTSASGNRALATGFGWLLLVAGFVTGQHEGLPAAK
jgi:hypothetical protein